jgi:hypothetical protein
MQLSEAFGFVYGIMKDYLERFSKRMEFVAIVDSIVGRINKNQEIERLFSHGELDNIIMSILVFIMETTLTEEHSCTIEAITEFLADILPSYGKKMSLTELENLSRYLVKDILQNKGEIRTYPIIDYFGDMNNFHVRLITDKLDKKNNVLYELTKQGFDFLFRTKEVDDELGFEIEAIRLRMLISKKNYKKATSQVKLILKMLNEKRNELLQFEQQLRNDVISVSGQYDSIVRNLDNMLKDEYETMREVERVIELAQVSLNEENRRGITPDDKSRIAQREILSISSDVQHALGIQRELLIKCNDLRELYLSVLQDSLLFYQVRRFDLAEQVLWKMEKQSFSNVIDLNKFNAGLLTPLFLPNLRRSLNLTLFYERQVKLRESEDEIIIDEDETIEDHSKSKRIKSRNDAHVRVICLLLEYAKTHSSFLFSEFWEHIMSHKNITEMTNERLLFLNMLKLYEIREIDIIKWRYTGVLTHECTGEFDLDYCLTRCAEIDRTLYNVERLTIEKNESKVLCQLKTGEQVSMDDLLFEVSSSETNG